MKARDRRVWILGLVIAIAVMMAVMSMPQVLKPVARFIVKSMGPY
jgi:hypothetical protein